RSSSVPSSASRIAMRPSLATATAPRRLGSGRSSSNVPSGAASSAGSACTSTTSNDAAETAVRSSGSGVHSNALQQDATAGAPESTSPLGAANSQVRYRQLVEDSPSGYVASTTRNDGGAADTLNSRTHGHAPPSDTRGAFNGVDAQMRALPRDVMRTTS